MVDWRILAVGAAVAAGVIGVQQIAISRGHTALANEKTAHAETRAAHALTLQRQAAVVNGLLDDAMRTQRSLNAAEADRNTKASQELENVRLENRRLRDNPATRVRLVAATCPAAPDPSRGDVPGVPAAGPVESASPEVTGIEKQRVLDFDGAYAEDIEALKYLQSYSAACHAARK